MADHRRMDDGTIEGDRELATANGDGKAERLQDREIREVRATDIEPYTGLRYLSKLFRFMAIIMVLLLVAEVVTGIYTQGSASLPTLLGESSRLIVLAGVLWGTGDLALLLVDVGHDVRAARILMARVAHAAKVPPLVPQRASVEAPSNARAADVAVVPPPRTIADRADADGEGPPIP
ncbi:MAG: hypothetical protein ACHQWU_14445 [Gemmatimonadales bacterium]